MAAIFHVVESFVLLLLQLPIGGARGYGVVFGGIPVRIIELVVLVLVLVVWLVLRYVFAVLSNDRSISLRLISILWFVVVAEGWDIIFFFSFGYNVWPLSLSLLYLIVVIKLTGVFV